MSEWQVTTLDQLGRIVTGKTPPTSDAANYGGAVPFITPSDMDGRRYIDTTGRCLTSKGVASVANARIPRDAVLVSCIGSDMGKAAMAAEESITNQQINSIIVAGPFDPRFVYYNLKMRKDEIRASASGSAQPILNKSAFGRLRIALPPLGLQRATADVLSLLDDKIDLNRRTNETLEAMARAVFKSWFVDFDPVHAKAAGKAPAHMDAETAALFPDAFGEDGLPVGWRLGTVGDVANLNASSWTARKAPDEVRYVDLANTKNGIIEEIQHFSWPDAPSRARRILSEGDTLVGTVRPGNRSFAFIGRMDQPLTGSTGFAVLTPRAEYYREFTYCACTSDETIDHLAHVADGGAYPAVRPDVVAAVECVVPPVEVAEAFSQFTAPLFDKLTMNLAENRTLATLRDLLLPKLMSGELQIREAKNLIGDVT